MRFTADALHRDAGTFRICVRIRFHCTCEGLSVKVRRGTYDYDKDIAC